MSQTFLTIQLWHPEIIWCFKKPTDNIISKAAYIASAQVRTNTGSAMSQSKHRWRRTISFLLKDLSPTFNVTNLFWPGITSIPCLQRLILCLENARGHKMVNFPTLSSWTYLQNILFFPLEIASDFLQHLKKTLLKLFSGVNLFRVGSSRHSLEKNSCM